MSAPTDAPWRRLLLTLPSRKALMASYVADGPLGAFAFRPAEPLAEGELIELELVTVEDLMVFHLRGMAAKRQPDDGSGTWHLRVAPFDTKARDLILAYARGDDIATVRRRGRRFPVRVAVEVADDQNFEWVVTGDVSFDGVFVESARLLDSGTLVALRIHVEEGAPPIQMNGEVMWRGNKPRMGFGVRFLSADPEKLAKIRELCTGT